MTQNIKMPTCKCKRCGYTWYLRYPKKPRVCPSCKSPYWEETSVFVNDLENETEKANKIIDRLTKEIEDPQECQENWVKIITEGWQRMFETSELPIASVDRIFSGGFSVYDWFMNTRKISEGLANNVAGNYFASEQTTVTIEDKTLQRAKGVLEWGKIISELDEDTAKVLGLLWVGDKLTCEVTLPEIEVLIQRKIWGLLERNLNKTRSQLIDNIETIIEKIDSENKNVTSWAEVIRFP